jgi:hypothetical protein
MLIPATKSSLHGTVHTSKACGTLAMLKIFIGSMGKARPDGSIHDTMVFGALLTVSLVVTLEFTCSQLGMFEGYRSRKLTLVSRPKRTASTALGTAPTTNTNKQKPGGYGHDVSGHDAKQKKNNAKRQTHPSGRVTHTPWLVQKCLPLTPFVAPQIVVASYSQLFPATDVLVALALVQSQ